MEKISEMIKRLCPEGVGNIKLEDVVNILDSQRKPVSKDSRIAGVYPYYGANGIQDYVDDYIFDGTYILLGEDGSVINEDKSPILHWVSGKIWVNNHAHILENKGNANLRYIYYALSETDVSDIVRGTPPKLNQANLRSIEIPLPPLSIQQEIVRILDSFSSMITNLENELASRQKQYEFYRNKLLTFDENDESVEWKTLGEVITRLRTGLNPRVHFKLNTADAIGHYVTVRELKGFSIEVDDKTDRINEAAIKRINERSKLKVGDVLFSGTGTIGRTAIVEEEPRKWNIKEGVYALTPNLKMITSRFMIYSLHTIGVVTQIENKAGGSTVKSIPMTELKNIIIPIPSLIRQQEIVSILDTFESLITNIKQELDARKKQYEYYREQLLTFE